MAQQQDPIPPTIRGLIERAKQPLSPEVEAFAQRFLQNYMVAMRKARDGRTGDGASTSPNDNADQDCGEAAHKEHDPAD